MSVHVYQRAIELAPEMELRVRGRDGAVADSAGVREQLTLGRAAASDLVIDRFGDVFTHVHDVVQGLDQKAFYCPGSVLKIVVDPNAPAAFGMAPEAAAFFAESRGFEIDDPSVVSVARYAPAGELLMSADKLAGRHALVEVPYGRGRVLLFGFRPQFRAQPHGTFTLLFNVLYRKSMGP